jgi:hypothetical protein
MVYWSLCDVILWNTKLHPDSSRCKGYRVWYIVWRGRDAVALLSENTMRCSSVILYKISWRDSFFYKLAGTVTVMTRSVWNVLSSCLPPKFCWLIETFFFSFPFLCQPNLEDLPQRQHYRIRLGLDRACPKICGTKSLSHWMCDEDCCKTERLEWTSLNGSVWFGTLKVFSRGTLQYPNTCLSWWSSEWGWSPVT